uniref:BTB domain-containing protein n=1 Tax=Strongyloides papillosus TaxID=174720 RepID=A0A0N5B6K2_STREA
MVYKRFVPDPLSTHGSINDNEKNAYSVRSEDCDAGDLLVSYDHKTKYYDVEFGKQKKLADDINEYMEVNNCKSFVCIELKNSENIRIPSLLLSYVSCFVERILSDKHTTLSFMKAKEFGEKEMKIMMDFIMTGKLRYKIEDLVDLFSIAHRFEMPSVCTILETSMLISLKSNKLLLPIYLNYSAEYKNIISTKTKILLLEMVNYYFNEFITRQMFLKLTPQALVMVMSSDILKVSSEMDIFRIGVIYMSKKEIYGVADPIFNCIRFNHCGSEKIAEMKKELEKLNKTYLSYVFGCFSRESGRNMEGHDSQNSNYVFQRNFNQLSSRNTVNPKAQETSKCLESTIQYMIEELETKKKANQVTYNMIYRLKKEEVNNAKPPQRFKVLPSVPQFLMKMRAKGLKKQNSTNKEDSNDVITINPYQDIPRYNDRLFSSESMYEINKFKNVFDKNYFGEEVVEKKNTDENKNIVSEKIKRNPYYYAFKDRQQRRYTVDSINEINNLDFFNENNSNYEIGQPNLQEYLSTVNTPKKIVS